MHILCIRYGTVLANTAVLSMRVCIVFVPVCGIPWWVTTLYYVAIISHHRVRYRAVSRHYACIRSSGIILISYTTIMPNFVSFATSVAELAHGENCVLNHSITQLIWCPGYWSGILNTKQKMFRGLCIGPNQHVNVVLKTLHSHNWLLQETAETVTHRLCEWCTEE